jgi:hypothetical protein
MFVPKHLLFCVSEAKKLAGIHCAAYGCKNKPCAKKRGLCHKHYHRHRRIIDPVYCRFTDFKKHALERKKDFTITLQEFRDWSKKEGYLEKGRAATIDRKDNRYGYHIWNIQLLTNKANIAKYHNVDKHHKDYTPF